MPAPASTTQYPWNPGWSRSVGANSSSARRATSAVFWTSWYLRMTVYIAFLPLKRTNTAFGQYEMRRSGEAPEAAGEPDPLENLLVLLARVWHPFGREPVAPPGLRELG